MEKRNRGDMLLEMLQCKKIDEFNDEKQKERCLSQVYQIREHQKKVIAELRELQINSIFEDGEEVLWSTELFNNATVNQK